jgi:uncharacterized protein (DUF2235 family)
MSTSAPTVAAQPAKKRLLVFLDGTWNAVGSNTNVWRMKSLCASKGTQGEEQRVYYDIGVNGFWGGTVGKGLSDNVREAYEWLMDNYDEGDDIFVFGFSRGAYTARSVAGLISKHGLLKPGSPLGTGQLFARYKRSDDRTLWKLLELQVAGTLNDATLEERWLMKYSQPVHIKMVGVWDTVGTVGVPLFSFEGISRSTFGFLHTGLRVSIDNGYHALAIDEHRKDFAPTLWTVRKPLDPDAVMAKPRTIESVEQRWFAGAHANVGGGCESDILAQAPLRWMMKKASGHGLAFRQDVEIDGDLLTAPVSDSYKEFAKGVYSRVYSRFYREMGGEPKKLDDGTHTTVNETIDSSVFDRWRQSAEYRPPTVVEWAARKEVDPATFMHSIRADAPSVVAPD